ncbi:unnamed protein product [Alopecurus aequalis]
MALLDFIELSDDEEIVDLSSDDETAEEYHNDFTYGDSGQHPTSLHDGKAVFVAEGEGEGTECGNADEVTPFFTYGDSGQHPTTLHDGKAVFVEEGEGEGTECENADEATPSFSAMENGSLGSAASQNCPHTPTAVSYLRPASVKAKRSRKVLHTDTPWRSPRLECKNKGRRRSAVELADDLMNKKSRLFEEQNTSARTRKKNKLSPCTRCIMCKDPLY